MGIINLSVSDEALDQYYSAGETNVPAELETAWKAAKKLNVNLTYKFYNQSLHRTVYCQYEDGVRAGYEPGSITGGCIIIQNATLTTYPYFNNHLSANSSYGYYDGVISGGRLFYADLVDGNIPTDMSVFTELKNWETALCSSTVTTGGFDLSTINVRNDGNGLDVYLYTQYFATNGGWKSLQLMLNPISYAEITIGELEEVDYYDSWDDWQWEEDIHDEAVFEYSLDSTVVIDGIEYKINKAGDSELTEDLYTYYSIGKITASTTNPAKIGSVGDSVLGVLKNIVDLTRIQPTISSNPAISTFSLTSSASDEPGTVISSIDYEIRTSAGAYSCDGKTQASGVTFSKYAISGGCAATEKTTTTGTITLSKNYVVGTDTSVSFSLTGTYGDGTVAKDNTGATSNPVVQIKAGTCDKTGSFSQLATTYPYYTTSAAIDAPTSGTKSNSALTSSSGVTLALVKDQYLWILSPTELNNVSIQIYSDIAKAWADCLGGTTAAGSVTFTMANSKTYTYYAYRTNNKSGSTDTAKVRLY